MTMNARLRNQRQQIDVLFTDESPTAETRMNAKNRGTRWSWLLSTRFVTSYRGLQAMKNKSP